MSELLYSHEEMLRNLQMLCRRYRPLAFARTTALTRDGRAIVLLTMGYPRAKKHLLIQASIHGREYVNSLLVMKQAKAFLEGYPCSRYLGISYKELLNSVCFHILPMTNPDGAAICQQGPAPSEMPLSGKNFVPPAREFLPGRGQNSGNAGRPTPRAWI